MERSEPRWFEPSVTGNWLAVGSSQNVCQDRLMRRLRLNGRKDLPDSGRVERTRLTATKHVYGSFEHQMSLAIEIMKRRLLVLERLAKHPTRR